MTSVVRRAICGQVASCYHLDIANYCPSDSVLSRIKETRTLRLRQMSAVGGGEL